jgi:endonuclease/exonuclease/phosphatase family metal-dependent hydrolase
MKKSIVVFSLMISVFTGISQEYLNIMTFNIRYNNPADSLNAWPFRIDKVTSQVMFHEADIVGVQEALFEQIQDMDRRLTKYKYVGVGRDDGKEKGEFSAIFFDTTRLQLLRSQTFWLSETPQVPGSKSWDAAITRLVTWAEFRDKKTQKRFFIFNTHFDHIGKVARAESAKLLLRYSAEIAGSIPYIVTGDFNATPDQEPIQLLTNTKSPLYLIDTKSVSATAHYGPTGTFNGFQSQETGDLPIDYIFIKNSVKVLKHATLSETWKGRFSSDHFPVLARVIIQ